jgi:hypothetical protein
MVKRYTMLSLTAVSKYSWRIIWFSDILRKKTWQPVLPEVPSLEMLQGLNLREDYQIEG